MKNKNVAGVLALLAGVFGTHRFYLGQRFLGAIYFLMFFGGITMALQGEPPIPIILAALLSLVDSIVFFAMPWEDFDKRYNKAWFKKQQQEGPRELPAYTPTQEPVSWSSQFDFNKKEGIRKFRAYEFTGAVSNFLEALRINEEDPATCFNLACCYSMLEQTGPAFYYLEQAVAFGFEHEEKIRTHKALANMRAQPEFEDFIKKHFPAPEAEPIAEALEELLDLNTQEEPEITEPLLQLENLKNRGILTEEEYEMQKERLFGYR